MRSKDEVRERCEDLRRRRLRERKQSRLACSHRNCAFNRMVRVAGKGRFGLCTNPEVTHRGGRARLIVCDRDEVAESCRAYEQRVTEEEVEEEFERILRDPAWCGNEYPKLAIMLWFLQDSEPRGRTRRLASYGAEALMALWKLVFFKWW